MLRNLRQAWAKKFDTIYFLPKDVPLTKELIEKLRGPRQYVDHVPDRGGLDALPFSIENNTKLAFGFVAVISAAFALPIFIVYLHNQK